MEANEMQPRTGDEGGQALKEFQRAHHQMGRAIAIRGFELEDDVAGRGAAQAFVAESRARDVATEPFEFLSLVGSTPGSRMQAKPLGADTALGVWGFVTRQLQGGIFPRQHFLSSPRPQRNAVRAGRGVQRGQGRLGIGVGQIRHLGVVCHKRAVTG